MVDSPASHGLANPRSNVPASFANACLPSLARRLKSFHKRLGGMQRPVWKTDGFEGRKETVVVCWGKSQFVLAGLFLERKVKTHLLRYLRAEVQYLLRSARLGDVILQTAV